MNHFKAHIPFRLSAVILVAGMLTVITHPLIHTITDEFTASGHIHQNLPAGENSSADSEDCPDCVLLSSFKAKAASTDKAYLTFTGQSGTIQFQSIQFQLSQNGFLLRAPPLSKV